MAGTPLKLPMPKLTWITVAPVLIAVLALPAVGAAKLQQPGLPRAQKHESRHEIDQLEDNWRDAILKANTAQMAVLLADDYLAITPSGTLQTKDQTLSNLRDGHMRLTALEMSDRKVRFYGTTALVTSVADVTGTTGDGDLTGSYRYTRVYVRNPQGAWKIVSFEASKIRESGIREPGEHK
jgi:ketosteroid isomerase-like protein